EAAVRQAGENYLPIGTSNEAGSDALLDPTAIDEKTRIRATAGGDFDPAELTSSHRSDDEPPFFSAVAPLATVIVVNFLFSLVILPQLDFSFLGEARWGQTSIKAVAGIWSVTLAIAAGCLTVIVLNFRR